MNNAQTYRKGAVLVAVAVILASACGGGGSDGDTPPPPPPTYSVSGTVTGLVGSGLTLSNGGASVTVSSNGVVLIASSLASGASYTVSVNTHPTNPSQICTVTNGSGTIASANIVNVDIACVTNPIARFAYAANFFDNTVSVFTVNAATGQLRANGYSAVGTNPIALAVDPMSRFVYVVNFNSSDLSGFRIDANSGALTSIGSPVTLGSNPLWVSVDPLSRFVYVMTLPNLVTAYGINFNTGALTLVGTVTADNGPGVIAFEPNGLHAYVANRTANNISTFAIDSISGALTPMGTAVRTGASPYSITVDPTGKFAYAPTRAPDGVAAFVMSRGALNQVDCGGGAGCNGIFFAAGTAPRSIAIEPYGNFAYVINEDSNDVSAYRINRTSGALTSLGASVATGAQPYSVATDSTGKFVYVTSGTSSDVSMFAINPSTGVLTPLGGVRSRRGSTAISLATGTTPVDYTPKFAYAANYGSGDVSAYTINATTGALTQVNCGGGAGCSAANFVAGSQPFSVAVDAAGRFAYVPNIASADISAYTINNVTGALARINCGGGIGCNGANFQSASAPVAIAIDPSSRFAYVANQSNRVSQYTIGANGALTLMSPATVPAGNLPRSVAVDPTGKYLYVTNYYGNAVSQYTIGADGKLTAMSTPAVGTDVSPLSIAVHSSGKYAYVGNFDNANVSQYTIDLNGALTAMTPASVSAPADEVGNVAMPISIALDPSGRYAYVASQNSRNIAQYVIGASGALSPMTPSQQRSANGSGQPPNGIAVDPSGKFVYVADYGGGAVLQYTIGASGSLTPMTVPSVAAGANTASITIVGTHQ